MKVKVSVTVEVDIEPAGLSNEEVFEVAATAVLDALQEQYNADIVDAPVEGWAYFERVRN